MQYKAFHKKLSKHISDYQDEDAGNSTAGRRSKIYEYLKMAPDLFYLMLKFGLDKRIPLKFRTAVTAGLAYFILPVDLIPEALTGPAGYIDDVFLTIMILHGIIRRFGPDLKLPEDESRERLLKLDSLLDKAELVLGKSRWQKLNRIHKKSISKN